MSIFGEICSLVLDWLLDWLLPNDVKSGIGFIVFVIAIILLVLIIWPSKRKRLSIDVEIDNVVIESVYINDEEQIYLPRLKWTSTRHLHCSNAIINGDSININLSDRVIKHRYDSWWYNNIRILVKNSGTEYEYSR